VTSKQQQAKSAPADKNTAGDSAGDQIKDKATTKLTGDEVANGAAETLHGTGAVEERYAQPDAHLLPGGNTLIADEPAVVSGTTAGTLREGSQAAEQAKASTEQASGSTGDTGNAEDPK
jgi:hypothetical protein